MSSLVRFRVFASSTAVVLLGLACSSEPDRTSHSNQPVSAEPPSSDAAADAGVDARSTPCCDLGEAPTEYIGPEGYVCCSDGTWHMGAGASAANTCSLYSAQVGEVCGVAEICGQAPRNALCAPCPGGTNGYKQIGGEPSCTCCTADGGP